MKTDFFLTFMTFFYHFILKKWRHFHHTRKMPFFKNLGLFNNPQYKNMPYL